uniref:Synaptonemal complex central element protein 1 n=1 Tax=Xenopus tropicalis TaxID=8364 RepID=A0A803JKI5_XENTR
MEAAPPAGTEANPPVSPPPCHSLAAAASWDSESGSGGPESLTSLLRKLLEATDLEPKLEELLTDIKRVQEETLQKLQLQCERKGAETRRQKELSDSCKQRIGDLTNQIQEEKLKRRMQRLEYEKQVEELMAKHKDLWELYDKKRLSVQIPLMEERKVKLIGEETEVQRKLSRLQEDVEKLRNQGVNVTSEGAFLRSPQAKAAISLFEEENIRSKQILDKTTERHRSANEIYTRLCQEWEAARKNMSEDSVDQMACGVGAEGAQKEQAGALQEEQP